MSPTSNHVLDLDDTILVNQEEFQMEPDGYEGEAIAPEDDQGCFGSVEGLSN